MTRALDIPVFDADNHMYETREALTKHLPKKYENVIDYVDGIPDLDAHLLRMIGDPEVRLRKDIGTANHDPRADLEAEMDVHEKLRLLYVACTRARDHLVVAAHHQQNDRSYACTVWTTTQNEPDTWRALPAEEEGPSAMAATAAVTPAAPSEKPTAP